MIDRLRRRWCRRRHRGLHLDVSRVGGGALRRCRKCGIGFSSLADAGALYLDERERDLSARACLAVEHEATPPAWEAGSYRVVRGGRLVGDGPERHVVGGEVLARRKVIAGNVLDIGRRRPGGAR